MQTTSNLFIKNMQNLPIWVKQVLTAELSQDLNKKLSDFKELVHADGLFQYLIPKVSIKGRQELETRQTNLSEGYYTFLNDSLENTNTIFEITIKNNWTLADSAKIFIRLYELEYVVTTNQENSINISVASFIASKIKTGEFLKKIGKIDAKQLEQALRYQKQLNDEGRHIKMASILIKMGFITDKGLDSLLLLKEEAKRRLPLSVGFTSMQFESEEDKNNQVLRLQKEIARLENENLIMKKRLKKLLNME
ncbi:MAG: hypothetical protein IJ877_05520 [Candidatus Gastranaerophilales bacterium]|nr:hypothetical protein [Candidatus Gastranaerophilales bacterium]